jgi:hypothetical protein
MSSSGRPKGANRSAQHEATPVPHADQDTRGLALAVGTSTLYEASGLPCAIDQGESAFGRPADPLYRRADRSRRSGRCR